MLLRYRRQAAARAWLCSLKYRAESKAIPKQRICGTVESLEPLPVIDSSGGAGWVE